MPTMNDQDVEAALAIGTAMLEQIPPETDGVVVLAALAMAVVTAQLTLGTSRTLFRELLEYLEKHPPSRVR